MAKFAIFGDSYVKRLERFCRNGTKLQVPGNVQFFGKGGLRTDKMDNKLYSDCLHSQAHTVILHVGGNDITPISSPRDIFNRIQAMVKDLTDMEVKNVYVCEILTRGDFSKCPGLTKEVFDRQRKKINSLLQRKYRNFYVRFSDIKYPSDYLSDLIHLQYYEDRDNKSQGMKKYLCRMKRILCSVKL